MRITFSQMRIVWAIEKAEGTFFEFDADVPGGLPFTLGLVLFKTHAYTPNKDGNVDNFSFHWDDIRFNGPVIGRYAAYKADDIVYLQANGSAPIGSGHPMTISIPAVGVNPLLFGQVHSPLRGQVLVAVNGGPEQVVHPYDYDTADCFSTGWKSFRLPLAPGTLRAGANVLRWRVGPRPACADTWVWDGFSIKDAELQFDLDSAQLALHAFVPLVRR